MWWFERSENVERAELDLVNTTMNLGFLGNLGRWCGVWAVMLVLGASMGQVQADTAAANVERAIRDFFAAITARDAAGLRRVADEKVALLEAGRLWARVGSVDIDEVKGLPRPEQGTIDVSAVKVDVSPTHPSVAVVSFMFNFRSSKEQLAMAEAELKVNPANAVLRKLVADGGVNAAMFAMLAANQDGIWKVVCISWPS